VDRLEAMRVILAVVEAGSLSAGARKLQAPLPSVSRKVAELEKHLGASLLVRTSRKIQLTDAGRDYLDAARRILADLDEAERRASGEYQAPRGELSVTMPVEFGARQVLPIVFGFMEAFPEVTLKLVTADRILNVVEDQIDVAVRLGHLADSGLVAVKVGEYRMLTCAGPRYLERRGRPARPQDLADHDGVMFGNPATFWSYRVGDEEVTAPPRPRVSVSTAAANHAAALAGVGIARLFDYQLTDEFASGALVRLLPDHDGPPRPVHLVYARQRPLPLKVRAFLDWTTPRLRACCARFGQA